MGVLIVTVITLALICAAVSVEEEIMRYLTGKTLLEGVYELVAEIIKRIK